MFLLRECQQQQWEKAQVEVAIDEMRWRKDVRGKPCEKNVSNLKFERNVKCPPAPGGTIRTMDRRLALG
jgi:hypothetical protein